VNLGTPPTTRPGMPAERPRERHRRPCPGDSRPLRKSYGSRRALDGPRPVVPAGVVYGFLGPNGAGKTTTMRVLTGLVHADGGSVEVLGQPFKRGDRRRLFEVGALVESPTFYPYLSARANLRELAASGASRVGETHRRAARSRRPVRRAGDKVQDFSMGMKQRLGIAAALLSDPKLLLLDEPANGLDPAGIVAMRDTLRTLASQGKTVFVSSHLLAEIQVMADVVGIIIAAESWSARVRSRNSCRCRVSSKSASGQTSWTCHRHTSLPSLRSNG